MIKFILFDIFEHGREADNGVERRAQLMVHIGKELRARLDRKRRFGLGLANCHTRIALHDRLAHARIIALH